MFDSVANVIETARSRRLEIENRYPQIQIGKTEADRRALRLLFMSSEDRYAWDAIGIAIEEMQKAC